MNEEERLTKEGLKDTRLYSKEEAKLQDIVKKIEDQLLTDEINVDIDKIYKKANEAVLLICKAKIETFK